MSHATTARPGRIFPVAAPLALSGLAFVWAAVAVYVLRPLELGEGLAGGWATMLPIDNVVRVGGFWIAGVVLVTGVAVWASLLLTRRGFARASVLAVALGCFVLVSMGAALPAFQMHNQLESIIPRGARPDLAGT